jgi:hypothetical protein
MKRIFSLWLYDAKAVERVSFFEEFLPKPCLFILLVAHSKISTRTVPSLPMVPRNIPLVLKRIA